MSYSLDDDLPRFARCGDQTFNECEVCDNCPDCCACPPLLKCEMCGELKEMAKGYDFCEPCAKVYEASEQVSAQHGASVGEAK